MKKVTGDERKMREAVFKEIKDCNCLVNVSVKEQILFYCFTWKTTNMSYCITIIHVVVITYVEIMIFEGRFSINFLLIC